MADYDDVEGGVGVGESGERADFRFRKGAAAFQARQRLVKRRRRRSSPAVSNKGDDSGSREGGEREAGGKRARGADCGERSNSRVDPGWDQRLQVVHSRVRSAGEFKRELVDVEGEEIGCSLSN